MAQLAAEKPALLVLDEPTNHLDLDMRDALALALQAYTGAVNRGPRPRLAGKDC